MRQIILPKDQSEWLALRQPNINSTEASALFGFNPYFSHFELWHRKHDNISLDFDMNERVFWGQKLQDAIANGVAEEQKWIVRPMLEYIYDDEVHLGASFDYSVGDNSLLEVKNVDSLVYKQGWIVDGDNIEAPPHIELQVQVQLLVSGKAFATIAALVGGNKVVLIKRLPDPEIHAAILKKVTAFWKSIDTNTPPAPDFTRDAAFISKLYGYAEIGKVYEADEEITTLAKRWKELGDAMSACDKERDAIKSQLLIKIGDSERVIGDQFSISAGLVGPAEVSYHRDGYRNFRVNWKKGAK